MLALAACNPGPRPSKGFGPDGTFTRAANMCADAMTGLSFAQVSEKHGLKPGLIGVREPGIGYDNAARIAGNASTVKLSMKRRGECGYGISTLPREDFAAAVSTTLATLQRAGFTVGQKQKSFLGTRVTLTRKGQRVTLTATYLPERRISRDTIQVSTGAFAYKKGN